MSKGDESEGGVRMVRAPFPVEDVKALSSMVEFMTNRMETLHPFDALNLVYMLGVTLATAVKVPPSLVFSTMQSCTADSNCMVDIPLTKEQIDDLEKRFCGANGNGENVIPFRKDKGGCH